MKTSLDCLTCFLSMTLKGVRVARPGEEDVHEKVIKAWAKGFSVADLNESPPEMAGRFFRETAHLIGNVDIFKEYKDDANARVLELLPEIKEKVLNSADPFLAALGISIIGNYMDISVEGEFDWEAELGHLEKDIDRDLFVEFFSKVMASGKLMILGDNAGEIGLDTILAGLLKEKGVDVTYVVRGAHTLNDATFEDAKTVGMTDVCEVITSGVDTPGTVLSICSDEFLDRFKNAGPILSKGQGNFEALWGNVPEIYYAFKVKCPVVAELTGQPIKTSLFCKESNR